jgi:hypothetical protein
MKAWFLFILGSVAYFLVRYGNEKKTLTKMAKDFDINYWLADNWNELLVIFIFDLAAVIILFDPVTAIDLTKIEWFPVYLALPAKLVGSFLVGYGGGWGIYSVFNKKVKYELKKAK